ncbi:hypothetical protein BB561_005656 [Smittium simulii]|uniref:Mitochondrial pyruvate carrier n=1 Tax=Smittium simulii TaxID=133385 RepID=A0A2T9Y990_9FUNG|nr:hypothetical protein BB561_005656 [Smittium simulii]
MSWTSRLFSKAKSKEFRSYLMRQARSLYYIVNWGLPAAAVADTFKSPDLISGKMTLALMMYSTVFTRFAWVVVPRNYLLVIMHVTNASAQAVQMFRLVKHNGGVMNTIQSSDKPDES